MNSNYVSEQEYTYIGKINGSTNTNFAISRDEEGVTGFIGLSTGHYTFYPLGGNEVVLIKDALATSSGPDCEVVGGDSGASAPDTSNDCTNAGNDCYAFIDIVAVVHPTALGTITLGFANLTRLTMNTVLLNSGLRFMGASGTFHQTTMTNLGLTGERIPYYSNPFVTFDGAPTGFEGSASTNTANNTRKIKNRACEVQKNNNPQQIYGQIEGPSAMCPGDNINYVSLVTPGTGQGPSNYWWQCGWSYSTSPAGPFTLLNTNLCEAWVSANLGIPGSYLYLRLTVFPNTGNTWTTTKRILIQSSCSQGGGGNLEDRSAENERELVRPELFYLMPNPAGGTVMAGTHQSDHLIEQVVIFSANGDKVLESNIAEKAVRSLTFDLAKVPSGFYYVRFITNAGVFTKVLSHIND
jgi:hypothetical protein